MIGIIVAMQMEADAILAHMNNCHTTAYKGVDFYAGKIADTDVIMVRSGIGKVGAAYATTLLIERYTPSLIINTGISGGLGQSKLFDVVIAERVVQHDFDISPFGHPKGYVPGINTVFLHANNAINELLLQALPSAKLGILASGDQFIACSKKAQFIVSEFSAIACDMESGAISQVSHLSGIDFVIVRVISDSGDDGATVDYNEFCRQASIINSGAVVNTIKRLKKKE